MFKDLMHNLLGNLGQGNIVNAASTVTGSTVTGSTGSTGSTTGRWSAEQTMRRSVSKKIFSGNIEVQQVSNGYVINIATREGYEYETHIAQTITEVNEIIAAAMVAFQLEK